MSQGDSIVSNSKPGFRVLGLGFRLKSKFPMGSVGDQKAWPNLRGRQFWAPGSKTRGFWGLGFLEFVGLVGFVGLIGFLRFVALIGFLSFVGFKGFLRFAGFVGFGV